MHGIFVGGVWNVALYLVLEMLIDAGYIDIYNVFADFIAKWSWPGRISNSAHLHHWQVRTGSSAIQAGALVLAPVVPLMQITTKSSATAFKIGSPLVDEEPLDFFAVPNMEITVKEANGRSIPILENTVDLPPFTQLVRYVPGTKGKQVMPLCETLEAAPKKKAARLLEKTKIS